MRKVRLHLILDEDERYDEEKTALRPYILTRVVGAVRSHICHFIIMAILLHRPLSFKVSDRLFGDVSGRSPNMSSSLFRIRDGPSHKKGIFISLLYENPEDSNDA